MKLKDKLKRHLNSELRHIDLGNYFKITTLHKGQPNIVLTELGDDYISVTWKDGLVDYIPYNLIMFSTME